MSKNLSVDPDSATNPLPSQADFMYAITPTTLVITDTGRGTTRDLFTRHLTAEPEFN
jgi:hypothetical protein